MGVNALMSLIAASYITSTIKITCDTEKNEIEITCNTPQTIQGGAESCLMRNANRHGGASCNSFELL
jgi:hypothetical protein